MQPLMQQVCVNRHFCRARLCRRAVSARPSVCPSYMFVDYVKMNKHIFNFFYHRVATPFWFFRTKQHGDIPTETLFTGASNAGGAGKTQF